MGFIEPSNIPSMVQYGKFNEHNHGKTSITMVIFHSKRLPEDKSHKTTINPPWTPMKPPFSIVFFPMFPKGSQWPAASILRRRRLASSASPSSAQPRASATQRRQLKAACPGPTWGAGEKIGRSIVKKLKNEKNLSFGFKKTQFWSSICFWHLVRFSEKCLLEQEGMEQVPIKNKKTPFVWAKTVLPPCPAANLVAPGLGWPCERRCAWCGGARSGRWWARAGPRPQKICGLVVYPLVIFTKS